MKERKIEIKREFQTDSSFGKPPGERTPEELLSMGIVVLDKSCGPSSHEVSAWLKRMLMVEKSGHAGTLDPRVSGVLPVGIGRSSRAMHYLAKSDKEYVCVIQFHRKIDANAMVSVMKKFVGELTQTPPLRSAVARRPRKRKVYYLDILETIPPEALFVVGCQAGTYVRKLCFDMGRTVGCGAHMGELRRTKAGVFSEKDTHTLQELSDAYWLWKEKGDERELRKCVLPFEQAVPQKRIWVSDQTVEAICFGAPLAAPGVAKLQAGISEGEDIAVFTLKDELVSFGKALVGSEQALSMDRGLVATTDKVMMKKGTYPRCW